MSDLISREAAYDEIIWNSDNGVIDAKVAIEALRKLPPVTPQPEKHTEERTETHACDCISRETHVCDCISRQAVLKIINKVIIRYDELKPKYELIIIKSAMEKMADAIVKDLEKLPSVEPEKCGDCVSREAVAYMLDTMEMSVDETWIDLYRKALSGLVALPSVTPERPRGKWIYTENHCWICSECGTNPLKGTGFTPTLDGMRIQWKFCNMCGAQMEVDK